MEEMSGHMASWQRSPEGIAVALGPRVRRTKEFWVIDVSSPSTLWLCDYEEVTCPLWVLVIMEHLDTAYYPTLD